MKKIIMVLAISMLFVACNSTKTSKNASVTVDGKEIVDPNVTISGTIENGANKALSLVIYSKDGNKTISKTKTDEKGAFVLNANIDEIGLYQLQIDSSRTSRGMIKSASFTLVPGDKVEVTLNNGDDISYTAVYKGTKWAAPLNMYMDQMKQYMDWQNSITPAQMQNTDALMQAALQHKSTMDKAVIEQIEKDPSNPANVLLMTNLFPMMGYKYYNEAYIQPLEKMLSAYEKAYPDAAVTKTLKTQIPTIKEQYENFKKYQVGQIAPEIALPNPQGDTLRLSDLRGKFVMIDFWASWCGPCRRENPNVVKMYKKYHDDGFEVFSVSLDGNKEDWVDAIKKDGLIWSNHVSELEKWNSQVAQEYGVRSIPHSVLIDPDGKIIAEDLRGATLQQKLASLFKH